MEFKIERSIVIQKSAAEVYQVIADIKKWNLWSPWMHCEPTAKTHAEGVAGVEGQWLTWEGEVIGSGKMTLARLLPNKSVQMHLEFFKPWKSISEAYFKIESEGNDQSKVTWTLDSSLPFFMFFFKKMMIAYMGNDFDRGLFMLKQLLEEGQVSSKSIYSGVQNRDSFFVLGKRTKGEISNISSLIRADFSALDALVKSGQVPPPAGMTTLSHVHDIPRGHCEFTAGLIYLKADNLKPPTGYELSQIPKHQALVVDHYGTYPNIKNPWSMVVSYQRGLKKKLAKGIPSHEIYITMPGQVGNMEIHTQVILPVK